MLFFQRDKRKEKKLYNFTFLKYFLKAIFGFQENIKERQKKVKENDFLIFGYSTIKKKIKYNKS